MLFDDTNGGGPLRCDGLDFCGEGTVLEVGVVVGVVSDDLEVGIVSDDLEVGAVCAVVVGTVLVMVADILVLDGVVVSMVTTCPCSSSHWFRLIN